MNGGVEREPSLPEPNAPVRIYEIAPDGLAAARNREQIYEIAPDGDYAFAHSVTRLPTTAERLADARRRVAAASDPEAAAERDRAEAAEDRRLADQIAAARAELDAVNAEILEHQIALAALGRRQSAAQMAWEAIEREPWNRQLRRSWAAQEAAGDQRRADELELRELKAAGW